MFDKIKNLIAMKPLAEPKPQYPITISLPQPKPFDRILLPFTDRATYLTWRTEWRLEYARLSQECRDWKAERRIPDPEKQPWAQFKREVCRVHAREMMMQRAESKIKAANY